MSRGGRVAGAAAGGGVPAGAPPPLRCALDSSIVSRLCSGVGAASAAACGPATPPATPGPCQPMATRQSDRYAPLRSAALCSTPHQAAALSPRSAAWTRLAAASAARMASHTRAPCQSPATLNTWCFGTMHGIQELQGALCAHLHTLTGATGAGGGRPRAPDAGARPPTRTGVVDPSDRSSSAAAAPTACGGGAAERPAARPCACARPASGSRPLGGGGASRSQNDASSPAPGASASPRACARAWLCVWPIGRRAAPSVRGQ